MGRIGALGTFFGGRIGDLLGFGETPPGPVAVLPIVLLVAPPVGYFLFGVASWRTEIPSRTIGLFLLVAMVSGIRLFAGILTDTGFLFRASFWLFVVAPLAIEYSLYSGAAPLVHTETSARVKE